MMKRRISALMILLANMLILAHAVVPHHHHNKMFVAILNVLDEDARDLFNHEHGHEHHHDGNSEDCLISEAEAAAVLKIQTDDGGEWSAAQSIDHEDALQIWTAAVALYELSFTTSNKEDNVRRRPYVASGHSDFIARSKGLRAPPAC